MKTYYENGPEGMPRVEHMTDSTIDWVINGVDTSGMYLDEQGHRKLRNVCHAVAEEVLARLPSWPALGSQGDWEGPTEYARVVACQDTAPPAAVPAPRRFIKPEFNRAAFDFYEANKEDFMLKCDHEIVQACFAHFASQAAAPAQAVDAPTVPESVIALVQQYGDQRADADPRSPMTMGAVITAIRSALAAQQKGGEA